jgi:surfeit locus 1 family protein
VRLRPLLGLLIPLACAPVFVGLGLWQLDRHEARAAVNRVLAARLAEATRPLARVLADTADPSWRQVVVAGRFDYAREQVLAGRTSEGSPGVHLITPLAIPGTDTLVPVVRGWVYSPDAAGADLGRWREGEFVTIGGYLLPLAEEGPAAPTDATRPLRALTRNALRERLGAPVARVQFIMTSDSLARADSVPRRLPPPVLSAGPHRSYAAQWFAFAAIAVVGGVVLYKRSTTGAGTPGADARG